ncbi:helix-turn-helix transcriptional regulator [Ligilactobacillus aviarius]|uniref:helix-turn-helix transcriptional regulator n=1 Tax=Ligilactobacillus aviarius TaxID=1606 RepID=UPI00388E2BF2
MTYGQGLSHWRRNMNLRQWEVAETLHVTRQTISNWENDVSYPDLGSLFILSKKYHISVNDILGQDYDGGGGASRTDFPVAFKTKRDLFQFETDPFC